jgi:hypothetical protein
MNSLVSSKGPVYRVGVFLRLLFALSCPAAVAAVHAVSVFSIDGKMTGPATIVLQSNIHSLKDAFWVYTTGTYRWLMIWVISLAACDVICLWKINKRRTNKS